MEAIARKWKPSCANGSHHAQMEGIVHKRKPWCANGATPAVVAQKRESSGDFTLLFF